jgi:hypothetical protein
MSTTDRCQSKTMGDPLPIWMAALVASECKVHSPHGVREVDWHCLSDHALYTNRDFEPEILLPFGLAVAGGETVVVTWLPGDTGYTVRLERRKSAAA